MNQFKETFANYSSEYLLQKRALGDELSEEAHAAIESIFAERGEKLPPKPTCPILLSDVSPGTSKTWNGVKSVLIVLLALLVLGTAKALAHTWVGILFAIAVGIYFLVEWMQKKSLTPEQKQLDDNELAAEQEGLTELMRCAASGDLDRIRDLVSFGQDVNARSLSGYTALMYAVRNNHVAVAAFLLSAGADARAKSKKGVTATAIANRCGYAELVTLIERHDAR